MKKLTKSNDGAQNLGLFPVSTNAGSRETRETARQAWLGCVSLLPVAALSLLIPISAHAQTSSTPAQSADQYSGVSHPPSNDDIVANDENPPTQPSKPSPAVVAAPASSYNSGYTNTSAAPAYSTRPATAVNGQNPDDGVISDTTDSIAAQQSAQQASMTVEERNAHLISRPVNPDYGVVGIVASPSNQLAEGTDIRVRLLQPLSTVVTQDGQEFRAQVSKDVYKEGRVVIPMGSELRGRVTEVTHGHRLGSRATIRLRPDAVILPDGTAYHLYAQVIASTEPGTQTDQEGGIQSKAHLTKDLAEYGAGAGGGAIVGGVFGGPVGAGAGAIVGTGLVTTHMLLQKPAPAKLEQGSEVVFSLTEPMDLLPTRN